MELPFLVLASSLKRHLKGDRNVVLHAFHSDPIAHDLAYFVGLNSATFELRLRQIENRLRRPVTWPSHLTAATLLRLQLPSVLKDIDRVVYLDSDLVVLNDIAMLYDTDLLDFPLAACLDFWLTGAPPFAPPIVGWGVPEWHKFLREVVKLGDWKSYFNAGVLVMDLKRFRNTGLIQIAEEFLERTNYKSVYVDQDALNHVVNGAFVRLDLRPPPPPNSYKLFLLLKTPKQRERCTRFLFSPSCVRNKHSQRLSVHKPRTGDEPPIDNSVAAQARDIIGTEADFPCDIARPYKRFSRARHCQGCRRGIYEHEEPRGLWLYENQVCRSGPPHQPMVPSVSYH